MESLIELLKKLNYEGYQRMYSGKSGGMIFTYKGIEFVIYRMDADYFMRCLPFGISSSIFDGQENYKQKFNNATFQKNEVICTLNEFYQIWDSGVIELKNILSDKADKKIFESDNEGDPIGV